MDNSQFRTQAKPASAALHCTCGRPHCCQTSHVWKVRLITRLPFLLQIGHSTDVAKIGRFARYLREVFRADADAATLRLAAETLGQLVAAGGALTADVVEQEVRYVCCQYV